VADQWLEYVSQRACEQVHFWLANTRPWPTLADVALYPFATLAGEAGLDLRANSLHVAVWIRQMAALTVVAGSAVNQT